MSYNDIYILYRYTSKFFLVKVLFLTVLSFLKNTNTHKTHKQIHFEKMPSLIGLFSLAYKVFTYLFMPIKYTCDEVSNKIKSRVRHMKESTSKHEETRDSINLKKHVYLHIECSIHDLLHLRQKREQVLSWIESANSANEKQRQLLISKKKQLEKDFKFTEEQDKAYDSFYGIKKLEISDFKFDLQLDRDYVDRHNFFKIAHKHNISKYKIREFAGVISNEEKVDLAKLQKMLKDFEILDQFKGGEQYCVKVELTVFEIGHYFTQTSYLGLEVDREWSPRVKLGDEVYERVMKIINDFQLKGHMIQLKSY